LSRPAIRNPVGGAERVASKIGFAEQALDHIREHCFSVGTDAVEEGQDVFADEARQCQPGDAPHVRD
jgi:hypothetical protein